MSENPLSPYDEQLVLEATYAAFRRAAWVIERITESDVDEMRVRCLRNGSTLEQVSRIDRATIAAAYLRECADGKHYHD